MTSKYFTEYDKYKLISLCIKAATGVIGGSLVLEQKHPYLTLIILAIGAIANEVTNFLKEKDEKTNPTNTDSNNDKL
jgi:hypothetical protein